MPKVICVENAWIQIRGGIEYSRLAHRCAAFTDVARFWAFTDQPVNFYQSIRKWYQLLQRSIKPIKVLFSDKHFMCTSYFGHPAHVALFSNLRSITS